MTTLFSSLFGQSYDQLWDKVNMAERKDLPRDVVTHAESIYDKASKEKNFPHLLKSWVKIVETKCNLDPDSFQIANFPPLPHQGQVQTALYNAIMGQAYLVMKKTHISEFDEETKADYSAKARELFALALADKEALANESALGYEPLVTKGKDSEYYDHDLLSLLARFVIEHGEMTSSQKGELCEQVANYYQKHSKMEGYTLMKLKELYYKSNHEDYNYRLQGSQYTEALKQLLEESKEQETGVDVAEVYIDRIWEDDAKIDFARWAEKQFKATSRIGKFQNIVQSILAPDVRLRYESDGLANRPVMVSVYGKNATNLHFEIRQWNGKTKKNEIKTDGKIVLTRDYAICNDPKSVERRSKGYPTSGELTDSITLSGGHYVYILTNGSQKDIEEVQITSLRLFNFTLPEHKMLAQVFDNESGKPVPNALLTFTDPQGKVVNTLNCDKNGECIYDYKENQRLRLSASIKDTEDATNEINLSEWRSSSREEKTNTVTRLYTDREIYRPGQTVHICGIVYQQNGDEVKTPDQLTQKLVIKDNNWSRLIEQQVTTNAMGSFDFDYVLPKEILPGRVYLECNNQSIAIRVEEYKRPTFQVEARPAQVDATKAAFSFGDTIQVEALAKAFSGVPVQGAAVHYKVESAEATFWRWYNIDWNVLTEGDSLSNDEGIVTVPLFLDPKDLQDEIFGVVRYRVSFDVTDQAGESQTASYTISVSARTFSLQVDVLPEFDLAASDHGFTIKAINANQAPVSVSGTYTLYNIGSDKPKLSKTFQSNQLVKLPSELSPGTYRIEASATDRDGTEISTQSVFTVFDSQSAIELRHTNARTNIKKETFFSEDFLTVRQATFSEGKPAEVLFSPTQEDVYLGYIILSNDNLVERKMVNISRYQYRLTLPYDKKFGDGVSVLFWYVRNGHVFQKRVEFTYQEPEKQLKLSWSTFRDKLYPGQEEQWTLTIHDYNDKPVSGAELLATMYDASLDQIVPHYWNFSVSFSRYIRNWNIRTSNNNRGTSLYCSTNVRTQNSPYRQFDELTQYLHDRYLYRSFRTDDRMVGYAARPMLMAKSASMNNEMMACEEDAEIMVTAEANNIVSTNPDLGPAEEEEAEATFAPLEDAPALRSNFSETAFFYPHLLSDADGNVQISFTLPESLTEWKFLGLAHTTDVNYGQISSSAIARKDFMIQPNMPRFVREGDHVVISARIINQGETDLTGKAQMRLIDPETEQVVFTSSQNFSVTQGQTGAVSFQANISDKYPMLICEISGTSGSFSDGERNYLPVLSSKKYMTEAIPFWITDKEAEKTIDVSSLFNEGSATASHRRLVLEFTEHPEWSVIEALDGIKLPEHDNAPCFAASLYANTMASRLANSIPGFKKALIWAKEHNIDATSPLQDNQDLKEIILKDSPWVRDALAEAEQRNRLLDLFNAELMNQRLTKAKEKLQKLQLADGSWTWFEGMEGNYYITLSTCLNLAMLQSDDNEVQAMLERGLKFLDKKEYKNYQERKKHKWPLYAHSSLEYLYVSSYLAGRKVDKDVEKMREVYLKEIEKEVRDFTIQGRSKAACILRAFGHDKAADEFLESAVQYTITKPGMGRYYATDAAYYSWCDYRIPTQLAAMRALRQSSRADRTDLINEMQLWLIRQKQSQGWDSPINTIGAVDFLLNSQYAPADQQNQAASAHTFTLDGKVLPAQVDSTKFLADQLGYIRTELDQQLYGQKLDKLVVSTPTTEGTKTSLIAWGSLYAQYLEDMDRLNQQTTGELKVSVKLIKSSGNASQPVTSLHVGDEVTMRIIVTADRDMDFVQVRMQRPACFEPINQLSGYRWMNGRGGYVAQHDASTDIFFDTFRKGTMTYDIPFRVDREGEYLSGITTAQCAYAPEFNAHTGAIHIVIK